MGSTSLRPGPMAPTVTNLPTAIRGITQVAGAVPLSAQLMVGATIDQDLRPNRQAR